MESRDDYADGSAARFQESALSLSHFESGAQYRVRRLCRESALARDEFSRTPALASLEIDPSGPQPAARRYVCAFVALSVVNPPEPFAGETEDRVEAAQLHALEVGGLIGQISQQNCVLFHGLPGPA